MHSTPMHVQSVIQEYRDTVRWVDQHGWWAVTPARRRKRFFRWKRRPAPWAIPQRT